MPKWTFLRVLAHCAFLNFTFFSDFSPLCTIVVLTKNKKSKTISRISWDDTSRLIHHNINDAVEARLKHVINPQLQVKNLMSKDNDSNIWCQEIDKISLAMATLILINDVSGISELDDSNVVKLNSFRLSHLLHKYLWLKSRPGDHQEFFYSLLKYS